MSHLAIGTSKLSQVFAQCEPSFKVLNRFLTKQKQSAVICAFKILWPWEFWACLVSLSNIESGLKKYTSSNSMAGVKQLYNGKFLEFGLERVGQFLFIYYFEDVLKKLLLLRKKNFICTIKNFHSLFCFSIEPRPQNSLGDLHLRELCSGNKTTDD